MTAIKRALISLSDKSGIIPFAKKLNNGGVAILSTGGTARLLRDNGIDATEVSDYTGFPEMMDGRVKTLHPKIHGALLGLRDNPEHIEAMQKHGIIPIDMVVINLYPFQQTISRGCTLDEAIENIDIGGPAMLRSSAKNYKYVTVIIDPKDYDTVLSEMELNDGCVSEETNFRLAIKVFELTSQYDSMIATYLKEQIKNA